MSNTKQELKMLHQLEKTYCDPKGISESNKIKKLAFLITSISLIFAGLYLFNIGVDQVICFILACISGICFAFFGFYHSMDFTNKALITYTKLDKDLLHDRITQLTK